MVFEGKRNTVYSNTIIYLGSYGTSGVVTDFDPDPFPNDFWTTHGNTFDDNSYYVPDTTSSTRFAWRNGWGNFAWFQAVPNSQEVGGTQTVY